MLMKKITVFFSALVWMVSALALSAQNIAVKGNVVDGAGEAIVGANVVLKGSTTVYALTDVGGNFSLNVPSDGVLEVSSLGYVSQDVPVAGQKNIKVVLVEDSQLLDETIVVAFGTTTKEAFTGSASVIKSEELQKRQTTNVANALVGNVAGLQMRGASGAPGAGSGSMNIRGIASMYAETAPLIIVDGAPYTASLSNIPTSDIESVTVLKDAASAALYGARGAAGVILVTTRRSQSGNAIVNFDAKWGVNSRSMQDYETISDPAEYYEAAYAMLFNRNYYNDGMTAAAANVKANEDMIQYLGYQVYTVDAGKQLIGLNGKIDPSAKLGYAIPEIDPATNKVIETYWLQPDNWKEMAYKKAVRKDYSVSVNGGNDRATFYASLGYLNEDGIIQYSGYERISGRIKADYKVKSWLKLGANIGYVHSRTESNPNMDTSSGSTNLMYYTTQIAPIYPAFVRVLDANGNPVIRTDANGNEQYDYGVAGKDFPVNRAFLQTGNPLGSNRYNKHYTIGNQFNGTFTANADITPWLRLDITSNVNWGSTLYHHYDNALYGPKVSIRGELTKYQSTGFRTNNVQTLTFHKEFGLHNVNVLAGHEYYNAKTYYLSATGQGLFSPEIQEINASAKKADASSYMTEYNVEGYFLSAQYNYNQKYYVSASFRRDATSMFAPQNRWGNFWSVGGAWIISKENFMKNASWVDILKLKASVGQQGNDGIGSYNYIDRYTLSNSGTYTMSPSFSSLGNPDITWETTTNMNIGTEFSFFQGRLSGNLDFYDKITANQLFWLSVPESAGARGYYGNSGDIRNLGVELALSGKLVQTKLIDWSVDMNIAHNSTKILSLPDSKLVDPENGFNGFTESSRWYQIGGPLYNAFRHKYAGVNEKGEALYYVDSSLNGKTDRPGTLTDETTTNPNVASYYALGTLLPKFFGGFGTNFRIQNFDISLTFDYQIGGKVYDTRYASFMSPWADSGDAGSTFHVDWVKSWNPNNTSSSLPRWTYGDQYSAAASDRFLTDASYLNFQSFTVGYTLPKKLFRHIQKLRVYVAGENLGFWSARKGLDPRYSYTENTRVAVYSPVRTISGGVQLTF